MFKAKMKYIRLIIARKDFKNVLRALIRLGCVEVTKPYEDIIKLSPNALFDFETIDLVGYDANRDSITVLGTKYTYLLTGWIAAKSEQVVAQLLYDHICAWEIVAPPPELMDMLPVMLKLPRFLVVFYRGGGKPFVPLARRPVSAAGSRGSNDAIQGSDDVI